MAWLEREVSGQYHIAFRYGFRKFKRSLRTNCAQDAEQLRSRVERQLHLLLTEDIALPEHAEMPTHLLSNGTRSQPTPARSAQSLHQLFEAYRAAIVAGPLEANTKYTINILLNHLERILGSRTGSDSIGASQLQRYIDKRKAEAGRRGQKVSQTSIRKELTTLSGVWRWAQREGLVNRTLPNHGLEYPKDDERPQFQTWSEIERQIASGHLQGHGPQLCASVVNTDARNAWIRQCRKNSRGEAATKDAAHPSPGPQADLNDCRLASLGNRQNQREDVVSRRQITVACRKPPVVPRVRFLSAGTTGPAPARCRTGAVRNRPDNAARP